MIISVDPTNTEDIATFALVKQYRLVPLSTTLATTDWTADATNGGYTLTQNVSDTGILLYTDPSVVVAFNASVEDTTSAPAGQDANVIATEIQADATNTYYIVTFHADTIPVADVVVNLLIYGTTIPGQSSGEDPATAEEITAAVLQNLDGRVTALEEEMPTKADKATTLAGYGITDAYTKSETDTLLGAKADQATTYTKTEVQTYVSNALDGYLPMVRTRGAQTIAGIKTLTEFFRKQFSIDITEAHGEVSDNIFQIYDNNSHLLGYLYMSIAADNHTSIRIGVRNSGGTMKETTLLSGDHP